MGADAVGGEEAAGRQRCVLFASTGSNYGALVNELCTEETPLKPLSLYGKTKTAAEQHLFENCNTIAYRLATAFGVSPRMRSFGLVVAAELEHAVVVELHQHLLRIQQLEQQFLREPPG